MTGLWIGCLIPSVLPAAEPGELSWPPKLSGGRAVVSDHADAFLVAPPGLASDVKIAKTPPMVDFMYYPAQDYPGNPWSVWGDSVAVGRTDYVTSLDVDPSGRFLYYTPGAHGGSQFDGTPIVQFDTKLRTRKVIAFLHPFYLKKYGYISLGTFGSALSPDGRTLYVTWNGNRGGLKRGRYGFDTCAMTAIHIPASERGGKAAGAK